VLLFLTGGYGIVGRRGSRPSSSVPRAEAAVGSVEVGRDRAPGRSSTFNESVSMYGELWLLSL